METYNESDRSIFENAGMVEIKADGELSLEGGADWIELYGSGDGKASGNIVIHDLIGDSRLEAESLKWDSKNRLLTSSDEVQVSSSSGLTVRGSGFVADMARERYTFTEGVEGTLELDDAK